MKQYKIYILIAFILLGLMGTNPANAKWWNNSDDSKDEENIDIQDLIDGEYSQDKPKDDYVFPLDNMGNPFEEFKKSNSTQQIQEATIEKNEQRQNDMEAFSKDIELSSETVDFYTETGQYVAKGNARLLVLKEGMQLDANEIILDQRNYEITGIGNVRILKNGSEYYGDYIRINTKKESSFFDNPILYYPQITVSATTATMHTDEVTAQKGSASLKRRSAMLFSSSRFGNLQASRFFDPKREFESDKDKYRIVAKKIEVKRGEDRTDITMKHATIYRGKYKVSYAPIFSLTSDRDTNYVETIIPEMGNRSRIGSFIAPSIVLALPKASTLKAGPLFSLDSHMKFGLGAFARLNTPKSQSEFMYSSATGKFLIDATYKLTDTLRLNFAANEYLDNGWMWGQMPDYGVELVNETSKYINQANLGIKNRFTMGLFKDNKDYRHGNALTTLRYKWQAEAYNAKPLLNWEKYLMLGYAYQHDFSLYQTGDTMGIVRVGPRLYTDLGRLFAEVTYFVSGQSGQSPFVFDRYRYGQNNIRFRGQYYICKYLSLGYYASMNIRDKDYEGRWLTENQLIAAIGTEDLKLRVGFDTIRNTTVLGFDMLLGTNKTIADFDEMTIKDFDKDIKESKKEKPKKTYSFNIFKKKKSEPKQEETNTEENTNI